MNAASRLPWADHMVHGDRHTRPLADRALRVLSTPTALCTRARGTRRNPGLAPRGPQVRAAPWEDWAAATPGTELWRRLLAVVSIFPTQGKCAHTCNPHTCLCVEVHALGIPGPTESGDRKALPVNCCTRRWPLSVLPLGPALLLQIQTCGRFAEQRSARIRAARGSGGRRG